MTQKHGIEPLAGDDRLKPLLQPNPAPLVMIIVLNWNGKQDTLACLESLQQLSYPNAQVLVVDNGSSDGSADAIRARFPHQSLIELKENLGFAGGNNVGLRYALERGADYALLLNNDTLVAPDFVDCLVQAVEADPSIGAAGPTIYYHEQAERIWSAGGVVDWRSGQTRMLELNAPDSGQLGVAPRAVDFVTGCALLARRAALEQAGLLDERFFVYYEEAEWCMRAQRAGFRVVHVPGSKIWHKIPLDARDSSPAVHYYMTRNRLLFLKAARAGWRTWGYVLCDELRRLISWSVKPGWRDKKLHRQMELRALTDALRGRWGKLIARNEND
jgi:GT2 family glycosyltransferase